MSVYNIFQVTTFGICVSPFLQSEFSYGTTLKYVIVKGDINP